MRAVREMSGFPRHFCFCPLGATIVSQELLTVPALRQAVAELGYELVDAEVAGTAERRIVRLRIDHPGGSEPGAGVTTEDCRKVSRALEQAWDADPLVGSRYVLEVSSPGIERPVRFVEHWRRHVGQQVKFKAAGVAGTKTGRIVGVSDDDVIELEIGRERLKLPVTDIKRATLVVDWSTIGVTGKQEKR